MKKLLATLAIAVSAALPLSATQYTFENFEVTIDGSGPLELQLGSFAGAFSPSGANTSDWLSNWLTGPDTGYYDETGPEWNVNLALADNSVFAIGQQLYLWAFDSLAGPGSAWALFTDASWLMAENDGLDPTTYFLEFTGSSTALFGSLDLQGGLAQTSIVGAASVPESATSGLLLGCGLLAIVGLRRRLAA